jgi:hypothetical protein
MNTLINVLGLFVGIVALYLAYETLILEKEAIQKQITQPQRVSSNPSGQTLGGSGQSSDINPPPPIQSDYTAKHSKRTSPTQVNKAVTVPDPHVFNPSNPDLWERLKPLVTRVGCKDFSIHTDRSNYPLGSFMTLTVSQSERGWLNILGIDSKGDGVILYPNQFHPDPASHQAGRFTLPSDTMKKRSFFFQASPPMGHSLLISFWTRRPLNLYLKSRARAATSPVLPLTLDDLDALIHVIQEEQSPNLSICGAVASAQIVTQ